MPEYFDQSLHKLDPRLRMISGGDEVVNTIRAERDPSLAVGDEILLESVETQRGLEDRSVSRTVLPEPEQTRDLVSGPPSTILANVFIQLAAGIERLPDHLRVLLGDQEPSRSGDLLAAMVPLSSLPVLAADPAIIAIEYAEKIAFLPPVEIAAADGPPQAALTAREQEAAAQAVAQLAPAPAAAPGMPRVLVGIIDVQGFDFAHPDFLNPDGTTRFISIWDQGGSTHRPPRRFGYGSELTAARMNAALRASKRPRFALPATTLEPQSQMVPGSHGTHVASIAAGNHGVCPQALIAGVLISLPKEDQDRRRSFYDSTRLAHAVDYLFALGRRLSLPVSINISLGTNGDAHDASSTISRWIDYELTTAGRSVCVAAGNAGQEKSATPGDWGYITGRIHTSGMVIQPDPDDPQAPPAPRPRDIYWQVVGDGIADLSENELEIWYSPGDYFDVMLKPPNQPNWIGPVKPGQYIQNHELKPSGTFISIYNELYSPANGHNYIALYLSPFFSPAGVAGVLGGTWTVRLIPQDVRDGRYHAWVERDDPRVVGRFGVQEGWSFPSFFTEASNVDKSSVSSLACGNYILSVANYDTQAKTIHFTSSQGPTRDGRSKPDICAPGTAIVAANGFNPESEWIKMTGTSMASPYVAGVVARMLAADRSLTAAQISGIIRRTAIPLKPGRFDWCDDAGYGLIQAEKCLEEIVLLNKREEIEV